VLNKLHDRTNVCRKGCISMMTAALGFPGGQASNSCRNRRHSVSHGNGREVNVETVADIIRLCSFLFVSLTTARDILILRSVCRYCFKNIKSEKIVRSTAMPAMHAMSLTRRFGVSTAPECIFSILLHKHTYPLEAERVPGFGRVLH